MTLFIRTKKRGEKQKQCFDLPTTREPKLGQRNLYVGAFVSYGGIDRKLIIDILISNTDRGIFFSFASVKFLRNLNKHTVCPCLLLNRL
jgi:hypothetical protein